MGNVKAVKDVAGFAGRFVIVDKDNGEILDDAQGWGYKTEEKAYAAWGHKTRSNSQQKENMSQNIYDNDQFFNLYMQLRKDENSANNLEEKPEFLSLLPEVHNKRILNLGCGYGEDCKLYAEMGAKYIKGIDISKKMLSVAKNVCSKHKNIDLENMSMEKLHELKGTYDIVVSSLAVHYVEDFRKLCKDVYNLIGEGGYFLFSQEHPIFTATKKGVTWQTDIENLVTGMVVEDYPASGIRRTTWLVEDVIKYHRTFSDIINSIIDAGFQIVTVKEPTVSDELIRKSPRLSRCRHVPDYLFVLCKK